MNITMKELEEKAIQLYEENKEEHKVSGREALAYLDQSTAKYKGETIYSLYVPKIFPPAVCEVLKHAAETMAEIMVKIIRAYIDNPSFRKLFAFDKEVEALILNVPDYDSLLPIARVDIFLDEETGEFKFCELNTDGSSSMNEDRELNIAFQKTELYKELSKEYLLEPFELFDTFVDEFMEIYSGTQGAKEKPQIAIADFLELGCSIQEFEHFRKCFEKKGYPARVCEIRDLQFDGESLRDKDGTIIDAIYRRAVTSDILENKEDVADFLQAVEQGKVCLIGAFCTQVVHDKSLFYLLNREETRELLTVEEQEFVEAHIPYTVELTKEGVEEQNVFEEKDKWLIKPKNSYGARGIFAGIHYSREEWKRIIGEHADTGYVLQEFILPYRSANIDFKKGEPQFSKYSNLTGLYVYNGKFAGVYSRQSVSEIISSEYDENDIASVRVVR